MSSHVQITIKIPTTGSLSSFRELEAVYVKNNQNVDVVMEDASQHVDMEVDEKTELYYSSGVFNGDEAARTLKAALRVFRPTLQELLFSKIVVEQPMDSFFLGDKRGIMYGFDQENHLTFAMYIALDGVGSIVPTSTPSTPAVKEFGDYANLRRFYMEDL